MWKALGSGSLVGTLCAALLWVGPIRSLEPDVGLRWLFKLRGPVDPPSGVVIVTMNRQAAANIALPSDPQRFQQCQDLVVGPAPPTHVSLPSMPSRWPRCLHALLVRKLTDAGARVIAFDVLFRQRPPLPGASGDLNAWQDEVLAGALVASSRVVIAQRIEMAGGDEVLADVSPSIAHAALGSAPFPIVPAQDRRVDRFIAFKESGRITPTLPTIALQAFALDSYPGLIAALAPLVQDSALLPKTPDDLRERRELQASCLLIRQLLRDARGTHKQVRADSRQPGAAQVRALVSMYVGDGTRTLNFYGPAGTIPTVSYDRILEIALDKLALLVKGRAVFVGYAEGTQAEEIEHFATAFSSDGHVDLSGVEIAATAFANLLEDSSIRRLALGWWAVLISLSGLIATIVCQRLGNVVALVVTTIGLAAYGGTSLYLFEAHNLWIPIVIPMLIATPAGMLSAFGSKFLTTRRQREQLRRAFTYFVPKELVDTLEQNAAQIGAASESVECACVATDAANFTTLAETMTPEKLADFLHRYFETMFGRVASHGGFVSDVVGDAMLAIWPHRSPQTHLQLLHALLEMRDAAQVFNAQIAGNNLATRFGVDWGRVALTTVGAHTHYEYRAVGDAVNTATRIQELNKKLGTRVLLSHPALGDAGGDCLLRDLGLFRLRGKTNAVHLYELVESRATASQAQVTLCDRFSRAMSALADGQPAAALAALRQLRVDFPDDGPTRFFVQQLDSGLSAGDSAIIVE